MKHYGKENSGNKAFFDTLERDVYTDKIGANLAKNGKILPFLARLRIPAKPNAQSGGNRSPIPAIPIDERFTAGRTESDAVSATDRQ